jgi:hypothetical protein
MHDDGFPLDHLRHLFEADQVAEAAGEEVSRLLLDRWKDPALSERRYVVAGRPGWWWRFRLLEWARSLGAEQRCSPHALRAFGSFVRDLPDPDICLLVESLLPHSSSLADSA